MAKKKTEKKSEGKTFASLPEYGTSDHAPIKEVKKDENKKDDK